MFSKKQEYLTGALICCCLHFAVESILYKSVGNSAFVSYQNISENKIVLHLLKIFELSDYTNTVTNIYLNLNGSV